MPLRALLAVPVAAFLLVPSAHASFPGNNGRFAVTLDGCSENLYVRGYSTAGRALAPLTPRCKAVNAEEEEYASALSPDWSADGARLAYLQTDGNPSGLVVANADGSNPRLVPLPAQFAGRASDPSFAPDGRLAFAAEGAIWTVAVDGSGLTKLRESPPCTEENANCVQIVEPRWSPDGKTIVFDSRQFAFGPGSPSPLKPGLWLMDAGNGKLIRRLAKGGQEADWSPDSRRLVFRTAYEQASETRGGTAGGNLYVVRADGKGKPRRLVHKRGTAETSPAWSPDGRSIFWVSLRHGAGDVAFSLRAQLWRVRARGGRPRRVAKLPSPTVEEGFFSAPTLAWQPRR